MRRRSRRKTVEDFKKQVIGQKEPQEENVIPMINIIFLLLLYFMIVGNLSPDYNVAPPFASRQAEPPAAIPTVSVSPDGEMRFEGKTVTWENLPKEISKVTGHEKLKIHADAKADALTVSRIMKAATEAGILQFVRVTQKKIEASG